MKIGPSGEKDSSIKNTISFANYNNKDIPPKSLMTTNAKNRKLNLFAYKEFIKLNIKFNKENKFKNLKINEYVSFI